MASKHGKAKDSGFDYLLDKMSVSSGGWFSKGGRIHAGKLGATGKMFNIGKPTEDVFASTHYKISEFQGLAHEFAPRLSYGEIKQKKALFRIYQNEVERLSNMAMTDQAALNRIMRITEALRRGKESELKEFLLSAVEKSEELKKDERNALIGILRG